MTKRELSAEEKIRMWRWHVIACITLFLNLSTTCLLSLTALRNGHLTGASIIATTGVGLSLLIWVGVEVFSGAYAHRDELMGEE